MVGKEAATPPSAFSQVRDSGPLFLIFEVKTSLAALHQAAPPNPVYFAFPAAAAPSGNA
jgi:hypothetical protein